MHIHSNGLNFEVEVTRPPSSGPGAPPAPTVLLTMGLGMQLVAWPDAFVQGLAQAGYCVVRYDNRDMGLSSHMDALGRPNMPWQFMRFKMGFGIQAPYTLQDMAQDALGILDALDVAQAHLVGVSMGGMISQRIAATAPERALSLTSIMSSSGAPGLPGPGPEVGRFLMKGPDSSQPQDVASHTLALFELIGSPAFQPEREHLLQRLLADAQRSYNPQGTLRQTLAVMADTDRHILLGQITCPTLVMHGTVDPMVPLVCGEDTARRIAGARFEAIDGMGHDWPPALIPRWLALLLPHLKAADTAVQRG